MLSGAVYSIQPFCSPHLMTHLMTHLITGLLLSNRLAPPDWISVKFHLTILTCFSWPCHGPQLRWFHCRVSSCRTCFRLSPSPLFCTGSQTGCIDWISSHSELRQCAHTSKIFFFLGCLPQVGLWPEVNIVAWVWSVTGHHRTFMSIGPCTPELQQIPVSQRDDKVWSHTV